MNKKLIIRGSVTSDGKLVLSNRAYFLHHVKKFAGKKVKLTLEREFNKRSNKQNSLYWAWLGIISDETGNEPDDLHEYFKLRHIPRRFIKVGRREVELAKSTAELSSGEMQEYMFKVELEAVVLGINLPKTYEDWEKYQLGLSP